MGAVASVTRPDSRASVASRASAASGRKHKDDDPARGESNGKLHDGDAASVNPDDNETADEDAQAAADNDALPRVSVPQRQYEPQSALELRVMKTLVAKNQARVQAGRGNKSCLNRVLLNFPNMQVTFAELHRLYDETDTDGSGSLEIDEIEILMAKLNPSISKEMVREIFVDADVSKDGSVQFKELICCIGLAYILDLIPELSPEAERGGSKIFADTKGVRRVFELATEMFLALDQSGRGIVSFRDMAAAFSASNDDSAMTKTAKAATERRRNSVRRLSGDDASGKLLGLLASSGSQRKSLGSLSLPGDNDDDNDDDAAAANPLTASSSAASLGIAHEAVPERTTSVQDMAGPDVITADRPLEIKHSRPNLLHLAQLERQSSEDEDSGITDSKVLVQEGADSKSNSPRPADAPDKPQQQQQQQGLVSEPSSPHSPDAAPVKPRQRRPSNAVVLSKPRKTEHMMTDLLSKERWKELDLDDSGEITYMEFLVTFVKWVSSLSGDDEDEEEDEE